MAVAAISSGPFVNRNHFGGWMLMTLSLLIGALFGHFEGALRRAGRERPGKLAWLSSSAANDLLKRRRGDPWRYLNLLVVVAVFDPQSGRRPGIVCLAGVRRRRLGASRRSLAIVSLGAMLVAGVAWRGPERVLTWFQDERNLLSRFDAWRDAWDVIQAFPLVRHGPEYVRRCDALLPEAQRRVSYGASA